MVTIDTGICMWCNKQGFVELTKAELTAYQSKKRGQFIQDVLPDLSLGKREQLISGSHEECFDNFAALEDEDEGDEEGEVPPF